ncbi:hypothetical protein HN873_063817 [Arachis hypogaea]
MSASQRKGKGKATSKRKPGDSSQSIIALMHDSSWRVKNFTQQEKADQLLPANDPIKFSNRTPLSKSSKGAGSFWREH